MLGSVVARVLREKGIEQIHHANTVTTSCTFLQVGGLASRGYVADRGLSQTPQSSDSIDQKYGIWHDVFADTVDIHDRASCHNYYGPVLFTLDVGVLDELPPGSIVRVTKKNPIYWKDKEPSGARFFLEEDELRGGLTKGTFGQMIVIRVLTGILPFPKQLSLVLDDPQRTLTNGMDAFTWASNRLTEAAQAGGADIGIQKRICRYGCPCVQQYAKLSDFDLLFK